MIIYAIYFSNIKLRDNIISAITKLQTTSYAILAQSVERTHGKGEVRGSIPRDGSEIEKPPSGGFSMRKCSRI